MLHNKIREMRQLHGFSREETAMAAGITRQALGQIESEKVSPSTAVALRLSRFLSCTVEDLFWEECEKIEAIYGETEGIRLQTNTRVLLAQMDDLWIARPIQPSSTQDLTRHGHGIVANSTLSSKTVSVNPLCDTREFADTIFISGCDVGLGLLAAHTSARLQNSSCIWFNATNQTAALELKNGLTHIAAIHFSGDTSSLKELVAQIPRKTRIFQFAKSEIGWICSRDSNLFYRNNKFLPIPNIRLANRQRGAGARKILDDLLLEQGISGKDISGYNTELCGHMSIASAVSQGMADAGIGHCAAAASYGLSFVPVASERCILIVPENYIQHKSVEILLQTLCSAPFRRELECMGPYDMSNTGATISIH